MRAHVLGRCTFINLKNLQTQIFFTWTTFSLHMPLTHHVSISVQALTPKVNPSSLPALISRLMNLTTPTYNQHTIVSIFGCQIPAQNPSSLLCQKPIPYKVRVAFSKPIHAARARISPPGPNYGTFTAKHSSHHVYVTLHVTLSLPHPSPPLPHFLLTKNPCTSTQRQIFIAQCAV